MPKKGSTPASGSEAAAPRRSSRVSSKPASAQKETVVKPAKQNSAKKTNKSPKTKQSDPPESKDDNDDSLSALSVNTEDEDSKPPPKKKTKVEKPQSNSAESPKSKNKLAVGDKLSDPILLQNHDGLETNVLDLISEKGAIFFIYPKSNTPGCTTQACGYRDIHQDIINAGFQVFGLSMDSPKAQAGWKEKQKLPYTLLCDPKQQLIRLLGSSKSSSSVQRSHFIFGAGGKLLSAEPKATTTTSPKEALAFIQSLSSNPPTETS